MSYKVSVVMPTLNSARTLEECLSSIAMQDYPKKRLELIIADGGSTDSTVSIAKKYRAKIVKNSLRTAEAGKAVGLRHASGELVAFIDSDNILPSRDWLLKMTAPFRDSEVSCAEPVHYAWRARDNCITRYCALMGLNDPLVYFSGNYDRFNLLDMKWTRARVSVERKKGFIKARALQRPFPTVGANGFIARKKSLEMLFDGDYLFDVDAASGLLAKSYFAKADAGIVHLYSGSFSTFVRKQKRRITDFLYHSGRERKKADSGVGACAIALFCACTLLVFPLFFQALLGFSRKRDIAWFFHVPASIATLLVYAWVFAGSKVFGVKRLERQNWSQ